MKINTTKNVTRRLIAFALAIALAFSFIPTSNAKAYKYGDVITSYTYADGVTRNVVVGNDCIMLGDIEMPINEDVIKKMGFDKYGYLWAITDSDWISSVYVNPYSRETNGTAPIYSEDYFDFTSEDSVEFVNENIDSLIYDSDGYVIGFKNIAGKEYRTFTFNEIKKYYDGIYDAYDFSTYLPEGYTTTVPPVTAQDPTTESSASTEVPTSTEATTEEATTREEDFFVPVVLKKGNKYIYRAYNTDYVYVAEFTLSKNVLKFNGKKYKNVKYAGFVEKTASVVYITKKGQAYVVTFKGKKKTLLKKNAKSFVKTSKGFVTKIKKKSGTLNVKNK